MFWETSELAYVLDIRRGLANCVVSAQDCVRLSITMNTLGFRSHGPCLLKYRPCISTPRHHLHTLRCYARPHAPQAPSRQPNLLRRPVRLSGTVSNAPPAPSTTWVDRLPKSIRPYLYLTRIDKPIGTLLLYYPCSQSFSHPLCSKP